MKHIFKLEIKAHSTDPKHVKHIAQQAISKVSSEFELEWIDSIEDAKFYKPGDIFTATKTYDLETTETETEDYILAHISPYRMSLISLATGNRWSESKLVNDPTKITEDELNLIISSNARKFTLKETIKNKEPIETSNWPHPQ